MYVPKKVTMVEVGPRDGLQNESKALPHTVRIELIRRLQAAGLGMIEAGSFVSPKWVPQMADTDLVLQGLSLDQGARYPVLVPNMKGFAAALAAGARDIAVFAAASETFSERNINCSIEESFQRFYQVCDAARRNGIAVRGYISCVLGCPYEGDVSPETVAAVAKKLLDAGCYEISLGDTVGVGTPTKAQTMVRAVSALVPVEKLAAHFHDTYGQALANLHSVLNLGIATVDSSVAGLGGCPYASGAAGNVASEDVLYMLNGMGIDTGVDMAKLVAAGRYICGLLEKQPVSKVSLAWKEG